MAAELVECPDHACVVRLLPGLDTPGAECMPLRPQYRVADAGLELFEYACLLTLLVVELETLTFRFTASCGSISCWALMDVWLVVCERGVIVTTSFDVKAGWIAVMVAAAAVERCIIRR